MVAEGKKMLFNVTINMQTLQKYDEQCISIDISMVVVKIEMK